ncbi:hypothetical protein OIDMADRAFT_51662 [Oidiodendron maius Zn]|uniref:Uncharacterized protein n=1 Tax=Oidiodendron maius (strain Zn) TaxID=913774 RepID=A0A0C3H6C4_OIDMZ|nr:hypothetical protein OIDMADRAFT_51662 [Oidiodendron maius Zn]
MSSRLYVNVDCVEHREISCHPSSSSSFLSVSLRLETYCKTDVSRWASIMVIRRRVEWERNTSSRFDAHDVHRRAGEGQRAWGSVARPCGLIAAGRRVREASCEGDWYNMMYHMRQSAPADMPDAHDAGGGRKAPVQHRVDQAVACMPPMDPPDADDLK